MAAKVDLKISFSSSARKHFWGQRKLLILSGSIQVVSRLSYHLCPYEKNKQSTTDDPPNEKRMAQMNSSDKLRYQDIYVKLHILKARVDRPYFHLGMYFSEAHFISLQMMVKTRADVRKRNASFLVQMHTSASVKLTRTEAIMLSTARVCGLHIFECLA
ncbi:hypothetical protein ACFE04_019447 [Oxalis oulophora]